MTTDPSDYDPNELRGSNGPSGGVFLGGSDGNGDPAGLLGSDDSASSNQYRELFLLEQLSSEGGPGRPYLDSLPQSYAAEIVVFEWLEFLVKKAGFRGTLDVLRYYRSIEWIAEGVETRLREYLASFDDGGNSGSLDHSDHLLSLVYVARLNSMD